MFSKSAQKWFSDNSNMVFVGIALIALLFVVVYKPKSCGMEKFANYPESLGKKLLDITNKDHVDKMTKKTHPTVILNGKDSDLIPKPAQPEDKWEELLPPDAELKEQNFLQPQEFIGIDTVSGSLRNANYDLRAAPPNPRVNVGPWHNSTIEFDPTGI